MVIFCCVVNGPVLPVGLNVGVAATTPKADEANTTLENIAANKTIRFTPQWINKGFILKRYIKRDLS
jgi:hypothetical protein